MGYEVHITRAEQWSENQGQEITEAEWLSVVESDPDLHIAEGNGPHVAIWGSHPEDSEAWLDWYNGNISTKNPDGRLLQKMLEIAARLDAKVQGDDGEHYDDARISDVPSPSIWANTSAISLILSLSSLILLTIVLPLDPVIRQNHPVGTPMPIMWALLLVVPGALAVLAWIVSTIFAGAGFFFRQRSLWLAGLALFLNCAAALYLRLAG